jgi:hypothetical protein
VCVIARDEQRFVFVYFCCVCADNIWICELQIGFVIECELIYEEDLGIST